MPKPTLRTDALRLSREVLGYLPSGVVIFDHDGLVEESNPAARTALGYSDPRGLTAAELFGEAEVYDSDGRHLGQAAALLPETRKNLATLQRKTMLYTTPEGAGRRLGMTWFPVRSPTSSAAEGFICLLTDLTSIHAMEEELRRRQSLSALGEMAAGIAHEFRNGLAVISGYAQMLHHASAEPARGQAAKILAQAGALNNIATEFLSFARPLPVQFEPMAIGPLLHQCAETVKAHAFARIRVSVEGEFPRVRGDAVLLTSAFLNLLRNACESIASDAGAGHIRVQAAGRVGDLERVQILDDGAGVAPEIAEKIFVPFFTTKPSGTGLGLAMVHKIITAHRGTVLLADGTAGHTIFEVRLPTGR